MGTIWRAEHLVLCAPVAIKLIDVGIAGQEETLARFTREAQASALLRSPHVVQILDYGVDDKTPFMVMELLEGQTLAERLKRSGRLTRAETARFVTHVARAIGRAHEAGITHRDLKPENIFIVHNEDAEIAKVLDFGVAKVEPTTLGPQGEWTRTGSLLGTPYYMSPEQAQGNKDVDYRSDLWALGVIAFECLTGKRPFESEGLGDLVLQICVRDIPVPSELAPLSPEFDAWFARACARDPELRFPSAREMADTLREALGETRETVVTLDDEDATPSARVSMKSAAEASTSVELPSAGPTARDPGAVRDEAHAATLAASSSFHPSVLDAQAAERDATRRVPGPEAAAAREAEPGPSRAGAVLAVAGVALLLGLVGGFIVLEQRSRSGAQVLPDVAASDAASALPGASGRVASAHPVAHGTVWHQPIQTGAHDAAADAHSDAGAAPTEAGAEAEAGDAGPIDAAAQSKEAAAPSGQADGGRRGRDAGVLATGKQPPPVAETGSVARVPGSPPVPAAK